ncbi:MAG: hypothetical protein ATN35_10655 [Epulopiscium sp. Nele67-Bin004]|nr:MAG: hypothetical protein ATN35_10655 [Epulopiscium sp. Nele67-Bin004]
MLYEIPENWSWATLGSIVTIHRGVTYKKDQVVENNSNACLILRGGNLTEDTIIFEDNVYVDKSIIQSKHYIKKNDIIIVSSTGSKTVIGRAVLSDKDLENVAFGAFLTVVRVNQEFNEKYCGLFFKTLQYRNTIRELVNGTNINNLKNGYIENMPFPLPPNDEQQRIVDTIESLFSKLDRARGILQTAIESFENRKFAIFHRAFKGELTAKWREENGVSFDSWEKKQFNEVISSTQNGISKRTGDGYPTVVLRLADIGDNGLLTNDLRMINLSTAEQEKFRLLQNSVLMIRVNGSRSNVARQIIIQEDTPFTFCDHFIRIIYNSDVVITKYMVYFSLTSDYKNYISTNMVSSAGQNTISRKGLSGLSIPVPTLAEQTEIVRILDTLLTNEQQAYDLYNSIEQIDLMKKSILARAFRGKLGTNNPLEEARQI